MSGPTGVLDGLTEVRILELPVEVWAQAQEHVDELLREFTLLAEGQDLGEDHVPRRLLSLVDQLGREYDSLSTDQEAQLLAAYEAGVEALDLTYRIPPEAAGAAARLGEALDAADEFCRAGEHLLTLATPPDALAFRRWFLGEFVDQVAGAPPTAWPVWIAARGS